MKRASILAYGVFCYLAFLAVFLYLPAFLNDLVVPKSVNSGTSLPLERALLVNAGLLGLFAVQHTIMARRWFKDWMARFAPEATIRSTFVLATSLIFAVFYWQWRPTAEIVWSVDHELARWALHGLFFLGVGTVLYTTFLIDHFELFGLKQTVLHFLGRSPEPGRFVTPSLYRVVRHPMMLGMLLVFWSTPQMTQGHLVLALGITAYIVIAVRIEERDLVREFPENYSEYRRRVPSLFPRPWSAGSPRGGRLAAPRSVPQ